VLTVDVVDIFYVDSWCCWHILCWHLVCWHILCWRLMCHKVSRNCYQMSWYSVAEVGGCHGNVTDPGTDSKKHLRVQDRVTRNGPGQSCWRGDCHAGDFPVSLLLVYIELYDMNAWADSHVFKLWTSLVSCTISFAPCDIVNTLVMHIIT